MFYLLPFTFFFKQYLVAHPVNIFILFVVCWGNIIIKSQTHWGWKRPSRSLNPMLDQIVAIGSMSSHFLNASRDSDSTTSCGSPLQSLTFSQSLILLILWILPDVLPNLNVPWQRTRPFLLVLSLVAWEKKTTPISLHSLFRLPVFFSSSWAPPPPSVIPHVTCLQTLKHLPSPPLDMLQHLHIFLEFRGSELNTGTEGVVSPVGVQRDNQCHGLHSHNCFWHEPGCHCLLGIHWLMLSRCLLAPTGSFLATLPPVCGLAWGCFDLRAAPSTSLCWAPHRCS